MSLLYSAIQSKSLSFVKYFHRNYERCRGSREAKLIISTACQCGTLEILQFLVRKGYDLHEAEDHALYGTCARGNYDLVKFLIEKGADPNANGTDSLEEAIRNDCLDIVKLLMENGADPYNCGSLASAIRWTNVKISNYVRGVLHG